MRAVPGDEGCSRDAFLWVPRRRDTVRWCRQGEASLACVPVLGHVVGGWLEVPVPGMAAWRALCQPVLLAAPDPGPPSEDEELKAPASQVCLERLKETVALQPKRLQHLPGHPW